MRNRRSGVADGRPERVRHALEGLVANRMPPVVVVALLEVVDVDERERHRVTALIVDRLGHLVEGAMTEQLRKLSCADVLELVGRAHAAGQLEDAVERGLAVGVAQAAQPCARHRASHVAIGRPGARAPRLQVLGAAHAFFIVGPETPLESRPARWPSAEAYA